MKKHNHPESLSSTQPQEELETRDHASLPGVASGRDGAGEGASPRGAEVPFARAYAESIVESLRAPLVVLDSNLCVEHANRAFYEMFSLTPAETTGRPFRELDRGQWNIPELERRLREVLEGRQELEEYRVDHDFPGPGHSSMLLSARQIHDALGDTTRVLLEVENTTARTQAEKVRNTLAAIVTSSDDAIVSKDLTGVITSWNAGAERLFGYTAAEAIGNPVSMLIPAHLENEEPRILFLISNRKGVDHYETVRKRKDGSLVDVSLSVSPILDDRGVVIGASKIARDITQQKALEASLHESSRRKNEFIAVLAHELRNPLAPIRNALHILQSTAGRDAVVDTATDMMQRQLRLIVRLVDDLLDVSRISHGKIDLRREPVELNTLIHEVVEGARALIRCVDQEITIVTSSEPIEVRADPARLAQVIGNIVNNACKFTGDGGRITVIIEGDEAHAVIRVRDNGIGIAPEKRGMIFDMFTQVDTSLEQTERGLGIGLALAKKLVELHGGMIEVRSEGLGRGSEFVVRLPRGGSDAASPESSVSQMPKLSGRRILVVDDNNDAVTSLGILLEMMGNEIRTARDGLEAFEFASAFRPELILLDIGLPRMNGYDVCRRIRLEAWGQAITIVALTGWGQKEDVQRSIEAGFDGHLVKPVELSALTKVLGEVEVPVAGSSGDKRRATGFGGGQPPVGGA